MPILAKYVHVKKVHNSLEESCKELASGVMAVDIVIALLFSILYFICTDYLDLLKSGQFWRLFANLLFAHLLSDFYLQADSWIRDKTFGNKTTFYHFLIVFASSLVFSFEKRFVAYAFLLATVHVSIDYVKHFIREHLWQFLIDQALHVISIVVVVMLFLKTSCVSNMFMARSQYGLIIPSFACAVLFCLAPSNYLVRATLEYYGKHAAHGNYSTLSISLKHSPGALMGSLERTLIFLFIIMGSFHAAGFVVAAKSLLRFMNSEGRRTALVLAGTLLSVTFAVLCACVLKYLVLDIARARVFIDYLVSVIRLWPNVLFG